jgi:hypothetical protein
MTEIEGCDYSYDPPDPAGLAAAGKNFAVRYGAVGNSAKFLTAPEVQGLHAAGLTIIANVEETAKALQGTAAGVRHATAGDAFFRGLGMPPDRPIYFSVDWDAQPADWPAVDAALQGAASVLGSGRVGVYGSYDTIAHCVAAGTATWFWQTYAWSGGRWHPACHLQQYKNGVALAGGTVDLTRAVTADHGQWGEGSMAWILVPCLVQLRGEFNAVAPTRDKASDGSVGDAAHADTSSDHNPDETGHVPIIDADTVNEVHAIDVDATGPWPSGWTMERFVQYLLAECRAGREKRLRYVIYRSRIWSGSSGWVQKPYDGLNPHYEHAHFSASYDTAREADTSPYGLKGLIGVSAQDVIDALKSQAGKDALWAAIAQRDVIPGYDGNGAAIPEDPADPAANNITTLTVLARVGRLATVLSPERILALVANTGQIPALRAEVAKAAGDDVDEQAIVAGVLAGLDPAAIAAAVPAELAQRVVDELHNRLTA